MSIDLRKRLSKANELEMPELWGEVRSRVEAGPRELPAPAPPSRRQRAVAVFVAIAVFVVAGGFAWVALRSASNHAAGSQPQPPTWLGRQARFMAATNGDPSPVSARWVLTDSKTAAPAVGLTPDQGSGSAVYLVVLEGHFVARSAKVPSGDQVPRGSVLTFTLDPITRQVLDYGVTDRAALIPGLAPFQLAFASTPSPQQIAASVNACSLLTRDEVAATLHTTVEAVRELHAEDFKVPPPANLIACSYTTGRYASLTLTARPMTWDQYRQNYVAPDPSQVVETVHGVGRGARFEGCSVLNVYVGGTDLSLGLQHGNCGAAEQLGSLARYAIKRLGRLEGGSSSTDGDTSSLFLPTHQQSGAVMEALSTAPLVVKEGCVLIGQPGDYSLPVWPDGFTAERDASGRLVVRDDKGALIAIEGEKFRMGGGYTAEFRPADKVQPREEQIKQVEEWLGYAIPERCLTSDVYGVWVVGDTSALSARS